MNLLEEIEKHKGDILEAKKIADPAIRKMKVNGWKQHVALECLCTSYQDQMETPEVRQVFKELMAL